MLRYIGKIDDKGAYVADMMRDNEECYLTRTATLATAQREADAMNRLYAGVIAARNALRHVSCYA